MIGGHSKKVFLFWKENFSQLIFRSRVIFSLVIHGNHTTSGHPEIDCRTEETRATNQIQNLRNIRPRELHINSTIVLGEGLDFFRMEFYDNATNC